MKLVTVFGGTGFLGHRIVNRLSAAGATVRIATRHPVRTGDLATSVLWVKADIRDAIGVANAVASADNVVNAVSAYVERGSVTFKSVHEEGAANVARACARQGVGQLVHMSGIGADATSNSRYIGSRGRGDLAVRQAFAGAVILRPSVMFGPDDGFLNTLAQLVRFAPVIPLVGGGRTRLQPVHADDVAEATFRILQSPRSKEAVYELGGPESFTLRQITELVAVRFGYRRRFISIPIGLAHGLGRALELLPVTPLTTAQVDLLRNDNIASPGAPGLRELGIEPRELTDAIAAIAANS